MICSEENRRIPSEIYRFFMNPGGHSLILRGNAGTGKTTFALQTIEDLAQIENSFYFSMRVSDHSLITQFPWLTEKLMPACGTADQKKHEVAGRHRTGLNKLKGLGMQSIGTSKKEMSVMIGKDLGDLEHVYDVVEGSHAGPFAHHHRFDRCHGGTLQHDLLLADHRHPEGPGGRLRFQRSFRIGEQRDKARLPGGRGHHPGAGRLSAAAHQGDRHPEAPGMRDRAAQIPVHAQDLPHTDLCQPLGERGPAARRCGNRSRT